MDVTKDNFDDILDEVLTEIDGCSFASIDLEISGLWRNGEPSVLSLQDEFYKLFLESASDFLCLQFGLTLFTLNPENKRYKYKTYSFFVFPHQYYKNSPYSFSCQANSIDFLVCHNFDFNKVFYKGIPYLNIENEAKLAEFLEERRFYKEKNAGKEMETIDIPEEHKNCIEETCEKLSSVLAEDGEEEVKVPGLNAYIRRLIYQTIKQRYPNGELLVDTRNGAMVSRKGKVDGHEPKSQLDIDSESVEKAVGFSKVVKALSKSGKMILGHNMFLDLCHIVNNFLCYVPNSYPEFKGLIKGVFPLLLDTKFMSGSEGLRDLISNSTLNRLYPRMSETPFSLPQIDAVDGYSFTDQPDKYHDAGFDSYLTGLCFISMYNYIAGSKNSTGNVPFDPNSAKLKRYINRVYMNNCPDNHFNFGGPDPEPDRSHYFHVSFPKVWTSKDIIQVFRPYSRININWINDESAWVNLSDKSQADVASAGLCRKNPLQSGGAVITQYSVSKYRSIVLQRKRPSDLSHQHYSPRSKRSRTSLESTNKSLIETIPEEKEEEDVNKVQSKTGYSDSPREPKRKSLDWKKKIVNHLTPQHSSTSASAPSSNLRGSVIEELEKDVDLADNDQTFASNMNWDVS